MKLRLGRAGSVRSASLDVDDDGAGGGRSSVWRLFGWLWSTEAIAGERPWWGECGGGGSGWEQTEGPNVFFHVHFTLRQLRDKNAGQ